MKFFLYLIAIMLLFIGSPSISSTSVHKTRIYSIITEAKNVHINGENCKYSINGSFFSLKTNIPLGTLYDNHKKLQHNVYNRPSVVIRESGTSIEIVDDTLTHNDIITAVGGSIQLLKDGENTVHLCNHFTKQFISSKVNRTAIGILPNGKIILCVATNVSIYKMADIMRNLGCKDALSLDGGSSSEFYANGKYRVRGRLVPIHITID